VPKNATVQGLAALNVSTIFSTPPHTQAGRALLWIVLATTITLIVAEPPAEALSFK